MTWAYLLDTNSYVRVAKCSVCILGDHPALKLRMTRELVNECDRLPRLRPRFNWVQDPPHPEIRQRWIFNPTNPQAAKVKTERRDFLRATADLLVDEAARKRARGYSSALSPVDESVLCYGYSLELGIVTDERPMTLACKEFGIAHFTTLEVLQALHRDGVLQLTHIDSLVQLWQYEKDEPHRQWAKEYTLLFGRAPAILRL